MKRKMTKFYTTRYLSIFTLTIENELIMKVIAEAFIIRILNTISMFVILTVTMMTN